MRIREKKLIFWDFDGTIKDSVDVKTAAYASLFAADYPQVAMRVREHHEANGGMSRLEKIPLYLEWASVPVSAETIATYCARFSELVGQSVIESPWVAGSREYLSANFQSQYFVLVTATPQDEIEHIIHQLNLAIYFHEVFGAPHRKSDAVAAVLAARGVLPEDAILIGDSEVDLVAAQSNSVPFLLRRTPLNKKLQMAYSGPQVEDFKFE